MRTIDTVVIGAGQSGLAASCELTRLRHEHVVLDRLGVGERWMHRRWDTQTLLTPNWMTRLPGRTYAGTEPDMFMSTADFAAVLRAYATQIAAPIESGVRVERLRAVGGCLELSTSSGPWRAKNVIVATGWCDVPIVPDSARALHPAIHSLGAEEYRNPRALPDGGVLVVGAAATGVQLADELRQDGRRVILAVSDHVRLPRRYRGADIMTWLDRTGALDRRIEDFPDPVAIIREPAAQLVGSRGEPRTIDLPSLALRGVELVGRLLGVQGRVASFDSHLEARMALADVAMHRALDRLDLFIDREGRVPAERRPEPFTPPSAPESVDLVSGGIRTVIWAVGHRRDYTWLPAEVLDAHAELRHHHGRTAIPGLVALGLRFQRTRRSHFIDGARVDAPLMAERAHARVARASAA